MPPARIFVVDDHPIVRQGLAQLIDQEVDLCVCGEAEEAFQALDAIGQEAPDIAVVDISLKGTSGIELIKSIRSRFADLPVLVLSMHDELLYAERVLRAGARGYVMKQEAPDRVINAIRQVLAGKMYVSERVAAKMLHRFIDGEQGESAVETLSDRELEVFEHIGKGFTTRQIAEMLHISIKTVESYRANIKTKLGISQATQLIRHAVEWVERRGGANVS